MQKGSGGIVNIYVEGGLKGFWVLRRCPYRVNLSDLVKAHGSSTDSALKTTRP